MRKWFSFLNLSTEFINLYSSPPFYIDWTFKDPCNCNIKEDLGKLRIFGSSNQYLSKNGISISIWNKTFCNLLIYYSSLSQCSSVTEEGCSPFMHRLNYTQKWHVILAYFHQSVNYSYMKRTVSHHYLFPSCLKMAT